jgi:hypothetical protein
LLVLLAAIAALSPLPAPIVERAYSTGAYPLIQHSLTPLSNLAPFALLDLLIAAIAAFWFAQAVNDIVERERWLGAVPSILMRSAVIASACYLTFLAAWGLNYRREPIAAKLQFDDTAVSAAGAKALAAVAVERVNALYEAAHRPEQTGRLEEAFARMQHDLGAERTAAPGRPKPTLLDLYFRRAAVDGMTDPYFLETLVTGDLLPIERPFVLAHEWSHLAGYANEGEANFLGWLTCLHGDDLEQYSGWLFLYGELSGSLTSADRIEMAARLAPGPIADRRAIAARVRRYFRPRLALAGWRVYDRYLKANRVEAGNLSYAEVVRLALGTRFGPDWKPLRK